MNKEQKRLGNKGFSIVELIVVIAIMAVLIAILAPTLIGKIEESRESKDIQAIDTIASSLVIVLGNEKCYTELVPAKGEATAVYTITKDCEITGKTTSTAELKDIVGSKIKFESGPASADGVIIEARITSSGKVAVSLKTSEGDLVAKKSDPDSYFTTDKDLAESSIETPSSEAPSSEAPAS